MYVLRAFYCSPTNIYLLSWMRIAAIFSLIEHLVNNTYKTHRNVADQMAGFIAEIWREAQGIEDKAGEDEEGSDVS